MTKHYNFLFLFFVFSLGCRTPTQVPIEFRTAAVVMEQSVASVTSPQTILGDKLNHLKQIINQYQQMVSGDWSSKIVPLLRKAYNAYEELRVELSLPKLPDFVVDLLGCPSPDPLPPTV